MGDFFGIGGGAQAMGNVAAAGIQAASQSETNATNVNLARENTQFQERMANTAYQRATADMNAAGINPMLAYMKGGAATPSGSLAEVQAPEFGKIAEQISNSAFQVKNMKADLNKKEADTNLTNAAALTETARAEKEKSNAQEAAIGVEQAKAELPRIRAEAKTKEGQAEWDQWSQGWDHVSGRIFDAVGNTGKAIHDFGKGLFGRTPKGYNGKGSAYKQGVLAGRRGR